MPTSQSGPDERLAAYLDPARIDALCGLEGIEVPPRLWQAALAEPVRDFTARAGKHIRSRLVELAYRLAGGQGAAPAALGTAVELLHAGSLIVDDIEDGATSRRGRPALHRLYGLPLALNAGNWLYFAALDLVGKAGLPPEAAAAAQATLRETMLKCHYGQALDLAVQVDDLAQTEVADVVAAITRLKTGALCALAASLGALAAGADGARRRSWERFGLDLGEILQMLDDWSSLASPKRRDKTYEDLVNVRPSWPLAWLASGARDADWLRLRALRAAVAAAAPHAVQGRVDALAAAMVQLLGGRARQHIQAAIQATTRRLAAEVDAAALAEVHRELAHLEAGFV